MDIAQILAGSGALDSAARELGIDPAVAASGAAVLLPAILGGFKNQAQQAPGGLDGAAGGLGSILSGMGGGGLLDAVVGAQPTPVDQGNSILGQIFGSKDVSRQVAAHGEAQSGISAETLRRLLPIVAMLVAGYMARQQGGGDAAAPAAPAAPAGGAMSDILGSVLGSVLGGGRAAEPASAGSGGGALGGLGSMLDIDGDGNPLNDIIGMAGRLRG
ncbi:MAG: DUF937 domain-containing protein [Sphingopyxis sp.]